MPGWYVFWKLCLRDREAQGCYSGELSNNSGCYSGCYHICVLRSRQQGLNPMLIFSQMVLKRPEMFTSLRDLLASVGVCMCLFPHQDENSPFPFSYFAFTVPGPSAGLRGCYFTVTFPWPLLKGFQVRGGPYPEGSRALVLGSSAETFLFPGVNWCFVGLGLKPPLRPSSRRDRLQPPPAHDSRSPWCSVHWSLLPLAGHCKQWIIPWQQGHCNMQASKLQRLLHYTAK